MLKFRKQNLKTILVVLPVIFFFTTTGYSTDLSNKSHLRPPSHFTSPTENFIKAQNIKAEEIRELIEVSSYVPGSYRRRDIKGNTPDGQFVYTVLITGNLIGSEMAWVRNVETDPDKIKEYEEKLKKTIEGADDMTQEELIGELLNLRETRYKANVDAENKIKGNETFEYSKKIASIFKDAIGEGLNTWKERLAAAILCDINRPTLESGTQLNRWVSSVTREIDDSNEFENRVVNARPAYYVHFVGDTKGIAADMWVFGMMLIEAWKEKEKTDITGLIDRGYKISFVAKEKRIGDEATVEDVERLLELPQFAILKDSGIFEVIPSGSKIQGTNLLTPSPALQHFREGLEQGKVIVGAKGEKNCFTFNGFKFDHFRYVLSESGDMQKMSGLLWDKDQRISETPYPITIFVPGRFSPATDYSGACRKVRMNIRQFSEAKKIVEKLGLDYNQIYVDMEGTPYANLVEYLVGEHFSDAWQLLFDVYPGAIHPLTEYNEFFKNYTITEERFSFFDFCDQWNLRLKDAVAREVLIWDTDAIYRNATYKAGTASVDIKPYEVFREIDDVRQRILNPNSNQVNARGFLVPLDRLNVLRVRMVEAGDLSSKIGGRKPVLFFADRVIEEKAKIAPDEELLFAHTGSYFWTPALHGALYANAPGDFQTAPLLLNAIIDGTIKNKGGDDWEETFPIYNKAFFARLKDGRIIFGRRRLEDGRGKMEILGKEVSWHGQDVNPKTPGETTIYTPMNERVENRTDDSYPQQDRNAAYKEIPKYKVGNSRFNIVIVNNVAHIYYDEVYLQPEGVVISLSEAKFKEIFGEELAEEVKNLSEQQIEGREEKKGKKSDVKIKLSPLEQFRGEWEQLDYLYGGLTLVWDANKGDSLPYKIKSLILEGQSLTRNEPERQMKDIISMVRENFKEEGWYRDYSRVTQETQLQQLIVRGPRCFLVKTKNYYMGVIIDGRQDPSRGANFADVVYYAYENLFQLLKDKHGGDEEKAKKEFEEELTSLQILNFDGGSSVGFGTFKKPDENGRVFEKYLPVPPRAPGPSNGVGSERPVPLLMVYSREGKGVKEISIDTARIKREFIGQRDLSKLTETTILFFDTQIEQNSSAFKESLLQLRSGSRNIPVVLLTREGKIEDLIRDFRERYRYINLEGVEFRTSAQLGLQSIDEIDDYLSLIAHIEDFQCIPLTDALCNTYEILRKIRENV